MNGGGEVVDGYVDSGRFTASRADSFGGDEEGDTAKLPAVSVSLEASSNRSGDDGHGGSGARSWGEKRGTREQVRGERGGAGQVGLGGVVLFAGESRGEGPPARRRAAWRPGALWRQC